MAGVIRNLGRIVPKNTAVFLCDMQEKFRPLTKYFPEVVSNSNRVLRAAKLMDLPVIVTEQYPKGLGHTVPELQIEQYGIKPYEKTCFTMVLPQVEEELNKSTEKIKSVILCGIETHACIQHTTLDLLDKGYDVHVVVDACSSRSMVDRMYALERMKGMGAFLTTSECVILGLAPEAKHPKFRELQKIIWDVAPDTGLLRFHDQ